MNGHGHSNLNSKPTATVGTLESLANQQATSVATASETMTMNVTIPCTATRTGDLHRLAVWGLGDSVAHGTGVCRCYSIHVGSCIAIVDGNWLLNLAEDEQRQEGCRKRTRWGGGEWGNHQGTATYNHPVTTQNTFVHEREPENTTSLGSPENMSIGKGGGEGRVTAAATTEEHVSAYCQPKREAEEKRRLGKSSLSTRRRRAAATHNQSERKRRDKINQRMMTLQKMVPNSSKTDKVSVVLDEVIDYVRQLQAQVQMISRTNVLMPLTMQQQIQLSMMAPMPAVAGMPGGVMSGLSDNHTNIPRVPPPPVVLHPFMTVASVPATTVMQDPLPTLLASQSSPAMTWDAYSRLAAMYYQQHMLQQQHSNLNPNN